MAYQREVRMGLVLYGGVSLAVYENGIAQELYRAVRKDGVYGLLAQLIDSDLVVDIISGTSAGGDNGIMLGYALANKKNFLPSAELWRNQGDIQRLMREQKDLNTSSVLNSTYYQDRLAECYGTAMKDDPSAPEISELDLFVTSTDANGVLSTVYDELGHAIDLKSHRAVFKLSFRGERKNDFNVQAADLAKLSRMTSCFPVAFEPVRIGDKEADPNFHRWGKLRGPAVFLDGGILNNKPFTSTIDAIAGRMATREVERFLIYVEPSPEQFAPGSGEPESPSMVKAGMASLISIPGYQSIAGDLSAIETHNQRAAKAGSIMRALGEAPDSAVDCLSQAGVVFDGSIPCDHTAYDTARYIQLRDVAVEAILNYPDGRGYFASPEAIAATAMTPDQQRAAIAQNDRRSGRILVQSFDTWPGSGYETLRKYDVFFRMRRASHLSNCLMRALKETKFAVPEQAWTVVNHFFQTYEILKWAMVEALIAYDFHWQQLSAAYPDLDTQPRETQNVALTRIAETYWGEVGKRLDDLLHSQVEAPAEVTEDARQGFYLKLKPLIATRVPGVPGRPNLLDAIDDAFKNAIAALFTSQDADLLNAARLLRNEFCRFIEVDRQLLLLQVGSNFESTELIRVVRFSPLDAQRALSRGEVKNKVRGSALAAFGGFFKKSWRANDIMVGRMDGVCLLVECLLTKERLAALAQKANATPLVITEPQLTACFPNQTPQQIRTLVAQINSYLAAPTARNPEEWDLLVEAVVAAAHHEIFLEEYPNVVRCAIDQEADWGRYRTSPLSAGETNFNLPELTWHRAKKKPDQVIVDIAAGAIAQGKVTPFAPGLKPPGTLLDEIPESVREELVALATIRFGKGLVSSVPEKLQSTVAGSKFYRIPFGWIAPIVYRYARLRRTQPDTVIVLNTAIAVACLMTLVLGVMLLFWGSPISVVHMSIVMGLALVLLVVWAVWFRR